MTFTEVCQIVFEAKGIDHGFIHHCCSLDKDSKAVRNPGGGFQSSHKLRQYFRVVLYEDQTFVPEKHEVKGGMVEFEHEDLLTAVTEAFAKLKLKLPAELKPDSFRRPTKKP